MSFKYIQKIPEPEELLREYILSSKLKLVKKERDEQILKVISGVSDKFLVIIGPCSADNEKAICDYASRLAKVQEKVKDKLILIPRIYTNKPRTTGDGYKGILHQPDPEKAPNMYEGLAALRKMHIKVIEETWLTAADEMLYPENLPYVEDILSYIAIGARSVENQQHRLIVSGIDLPAGMKNPTSGDISIMLNSIVAAQNAHNFLYRSYEVHTSGNPYAHAILRGAVDRYGTSIPNYHYEDLIRLFEEYQKRNLENLAVIVDTNHANSNKRFYEQGRIVAEVLHSRKLSKEIKGFLKGLMIESYIEEGTQPVGGNIYGKSITDPCIGWEESERLIYYIADNI